MVYLKKRKHANSKSVHLGVLGVLADDVKKAVVKTQL